MCLKDVTYNQMIIVLKLLLRAHTNIFKVYYQRMKYCTYDSVILIKNYELILEKIYPAQFRKKEHAKISSITALALKT